VAAGGLLRVNHLSAPNSTHRQRRRRDHLRRRETPAKPVALGLQATRVKDRASWRRPTRARRHQPPAPRGICSRVAAALASMANPDTTPTGLRSPKVAPAGTRSALLIRPAADPDEEPDLGVFPPVMWPLVRETGVLPGVIGVGAVRARLASSATVGRWVAFCILPRSASRLPSGIETSNQIGRGSRAQSSALASPQVPQITDV
jgi:hypothetical protein